MLLIPAQRAAYALGTQCSSPSGAGDEAFLEQLRLLTPRMEAALEVRTLESTSAVDTFRSPQCAAERLLPFRLTNGFVDPDSVRVSGAYDSNGNTITVPHHVDEELGIVRLTDAISYYTEGGGSIRISYDCGFNIPAKGPNDTDVHADVAYRVAIGVPDWLSGLVVDALINWRRNNQATPQVTKEYGFLPTLNDAVLRDIKARLYGRFQRPRAMHHWPDLYRVE